MDGKNAYLELMESLKGSSNNNNQVEERKTEFNDNYNQNHPAQTQLISWLSNWRNQHGVVGKRKPIERDENLEQTQQIQPTTQRRKVVLRNRKLIDE